MVERGDGEVFARALAKLGRKKREAFILMELEDLSAEEAGREARTKPTTMRTRLFHARSVRHSHRCRNWH